MMYRLLFIFALLLCTGKISAQDEPARTKPPAPQNYLTTILLRSILWDYNIGYAHRLDPQHTLEYRAGWVHRNNIIHEYYEKWLTSPEMLFHGPSFYVQWNQWKYTPGMPRWYWGLIGGYRYQWHHDNGLSLAGTGGSSFAEDLTISQWRNDFLALFTIGFQTSKVSTFEISAGARLSFTHTHIGDTRFHPVNMTPAEYDAYRAGMVSKVPNGEGVSIVPLLRVSSRLGFFNW